LLLHLARLFHRELPDIVHSFTIKCVVYGSLAARIAGVERRINAVAGMGHVFTSDNRRNRLLRPFVRVLLRTALAGPKSRLILQNQDDCAVFRQSGLTDPSRIHLIRSSGVDTDRFTPRDAAGSERRSFRVLLAARLLWDKGMREFSEAAAMVKATGKPIEFLLAGVPDSGNPAAVPAEIVQAWHASGTLTALGQVEDMAHCLHSVDIAVLPSYYGEGIPKSLIEAAACGLALVATDAPGCREAVKHGVNGLLVPPRDAGALANAILWLYEHPAERDRMGLEGRRKAIREFDERIVLARTLDVYRELSPGTLRPAKSIGKDAPECLDLHDPSSPPNPVKS
jgi:glycosyltransferase involved in cell wall biosynthesis